MKELTFKDRMVMIWHLLLGHHRLSTTQFFTDCKNVRMIVNWDTYEIEMRGETIIRANPYEEVVIKQIIRVNKDNVRNIDS